MRPSEVRALRRADVAAAAARDAVLVTVPRGKANQEGKTKDVRFVKGGVARALWILRAVGAVVSSAPRMVGLVWNEVSG